MNGELAPEYVASLRCEIVESQKARIDLLKHKLLAVAVLAAIGLGFGEQGKPGGNPLVTHSDIVLGIIPLVCLYIDQLCWHNTMRILVVAQFLNSVGDEYEGFIERLDAKVSPGYFFGLEDFVLHWSTLAFSMLVLGYGVFVLVPDSCSPTDPNIRATALIVSGAVGIALSLLAHGSYRKRQDDLFLAAKAVTGESQDAHVQ